MTVKNFKEANFKACYISVTASRVPYLGKGSSDEDLDDAEYLLALVIRDSQDLLKFLRKTQERRRKKRSGE